ncbi:MAG: hypothetical protein JWN70_156 [Planctomycetaceae bacterium]|nr:hypothetical protein [Planctomycetaceae bacterium]
MALNVSTRKPKKSHLTNTPEEVQFQAHLKALELGSIADYRDWCSRHGFGPATKKSAIQRELEVRERHRAWAEYRLSQKKREQRSLRATINEIFRGQLGENDVTSPTLKLLCEAYDSLQASTFVRQAFRELLTVVGDATDLIQTNTVISQYGLGRGNTYLGALLALAHHAQDWIRPPTAWKPNTHNVDRQFQSLARHLFARWPVPTFMDSVWFQGISSDALEKQTWFVHLGLGENIRTLPLPIPYTKRMAHHFMQAPAESTVEEALRWGQIRALGGSARLVKSVTGTRLRTCYKENEFWTTVIQFLIANPMLDLAHVGPLIDYLHNEKFTPQEVFVPPGRVERRPPPQPNLTMKGRSPETLLRNVEAWHRNLSKVNQTAAEWVTSGICGFRFVEGDEAGGNAKIWTATELLSSSALIAEGRKMKHCVATYARSCAQGLCSIWALETESIAGRSKVLTLEVLNQTRVLVQARGKCNVMPTQKERGILQRWADQAGLQLAKWI